MAASLIRAELDKDLLAKVRGPVSLFFAAGNTLKVAMKIVDDRETELLKIVNLDQGDLR